MSIFFRSSLGSWLVLGFKAVVQEQKQAKASLQRHERDVQLEATEIWEMNILKILKSAKADRCFEALPCDVRILPRFHHLSSNFIQFLHISPHSCSLCLASWPSGEPQDSSSRKQGTSRGALPQCRFSVDSV